MKRSDLHSYQEASVKHLIDRPEAALFAQMGTGKTVSTLTALDDMQIFPVLIVAPLLVAHTVWAQEACKWQHTRRLHFSKVLGDVKQRRAALDTRADIYVMNRENLPWLAKQTDLPEFRVIVLDELSSYRKPGGEWVKSVHKLRNRFKPRMIGLTGTPAPRGLLGLFSQLKCLDGGKRLGRNFENFKQQHFIAKDWNQHDWKPREGTEKWINERIGDICMSLMAKDYLELPGRMDNIFEIDMPQDAMHLYQHFEKQNVLPHPDDPEEMPAITAVNQAVLVGKLTQLASGAVYTDPEEAYDGTEFYRYHNEKARVMRDIIDDMQGNPILVAYWYRHSHDAILQAIPKAKEITPENIELWNKGEIPVMLIHPASAGHGIQLQHGGHQLIWYDMIYDLELYEQTIARLDRQGQTKPVFNHLLMARHTVDETIYQALKSKSNVQQALLENLKRKLK